MPLGFHIARIIFGMLMWCAAIHAQIAISGRVVDENGAGIAGARIELRESALRDSALHEPAGEVKAAVSSDLAGNFRVSLPFAGEYTIRVERQGFFLYQGRGLQLESGANLLTIRLNHLQEFADKVDVTALRQPKARQYAQPVK